MTDPIVLDAALQRTPEGDPRTDPRVIAGILKSIQEELGWIDNDTDYMERAYAWDEVTARRELLLIAAGEPFDYIEDVVIPMRKELDL